MLYISLYIRARRIKRAFDVSAKKKFLPVENQEKDPMQVSVISGFQFICSSTISPAQCQPATNLHLSINFRIYYFKPIFQPYLRKELTSAERDRQEREIMNRY
jgi:hypothetical protein